MDRPIQSYYYDSDDDRPSSSQSTTSTSEYTDESRLPSSLRKLLNPIIPSAQQPPRLASQAVGPAPITPLATRQTREENLASIALSRLRPWKKLPPPRPLNTQPYISFPPIFVTLPPPRASNGTVGPCSPRSPQCSPYYLPASHSNRDRIARVNRCQLTSEREEHFKTNDAPPSSFMLTPSSSSNPRPLSNSKTNALRSSTPKKLNTYFTSQVAITSRSEQNKASTRISKPIDKDRNRCLTCGSSFSTFANLTRHEKKCPMPDSKTN